MLVYFAHLFVLIESLLTDNMGLIANPNFLPVQMDSKNTPFTVQLGQGASIRVGGTFIDTGNEGATIQFGRFEVPITVPERSHHTETTARRTHLPVQQVRRAEPAVEAPCKKASVFERLGCPETQVMKRTVSRGRISLTPAKVTHIPTGPFAVGRNDAEASSSGGKLSRKQRRKLNAELRAQNLLPEPSVVQQSLEPIANVPTQNRFSNLKWVKRNSSTGELKQSFWAPPQHQAPAPQRRQPETISARVHRVLKVVKERGLMKKKFQQPTIPPTKQAYACGPTPPVRGGEFPKPNLPSRHRGLRLGPRVQEPIIERAKEKGKQIWRLKPREGMTVDKGKAVMSSVHSREPTTGRVHRKWIPKKGIHIEEWHNDQHSGESSRRPHHHPGSSPKERTNFDRSPQIEELFTSHSEPEIHWRRRSAIQVSVENQHQEEDDDTMDVEVIYVVGHVGESSGVHYQRRKSHEAPLVVPTARPLSGQAEESSSSSSEGEQGEEQEEEEEPVFIDTAKLARAQKRMRRQIKAKDKEISQLGAKMNEMMVQMMAMMQVMQKGIGTGVAPANHQASNIALPNPPVNQAPQVSEIQGGQGRGVEVDPVVLPQPNSQDMPTTSEPVTAAQLETLISEKVKAVIALESAEKLVSKGRPYPAEYDQESYPQGYLMPKFNTFNGYGNPRQHLAQFKASCGNTGGNDALLFRQFVTSLTATAFEWYAELPNDSVKTFAELETMFVKRFANATEKTTIADLALEKKKR